MVTFGAVKEKEYTLLEQDEYVLTLHEIEETQGQWGDRLVWKFLVAPKDDYEAYVCKSNGDEYTLWAFTDCDVVLGSLIHKFVEALTGRTFEKGSEPPEEDELIGKRLVAYVTHETPTRGKNAGQKREAIVPGSIRPFKGPAKKVARNVEPSEPIADEEERAALVTKVEKLIGRAVKLGTPKHLDYVSVDLEAADVTQLQMLANTIAAEVEKALLDDE